MEGQPRVTRVTPRRLSFSLEDFSNTRDEAADEEATCLMNLFKEVEIQHIPRAENKHVGALSTLGSKETGLKEGPIVVFKKVE
ncbi:hypothetical protein SESBI_40092 [Sesbania bispinosa]|nr:hypothetical protein SESBI_40092 [Sesbania bispinosa]